MANKRFIDFPIATTVGDNDIILIWQSGANKQTTKATILSGVPDSLNDLTDVTISGLTNGQILRYDSVSNQWENTDQGNLDLNDLNDVTIVSPSNGQVLVYNSSTGKWENSSGGYVPYVGAVTTVNLGAQTIQAGSFVKQGGTASQFLKADGSVDSTAYGTGSVTSVALTMPTAFSVAGSPITTAGTLAVTGAGTVAQYIRGDGSLADFPETSGGGSSVSYYLNGSVAQGTIGGVAYKELNKVPILGAGTDFTINANGYIASFITDAVDPNLLEIPGGNWNFETYFSASSGGGSPTFYVELYKVNAGGTATLIASNSAIPELIAFGTNITAYFTTLAVPTTTLALTDRLAVRYYVTHSGRTITLHTENNTLCQIITTFTTGLTALNGLTAQVQNFAVGTTGTDFNIASAVATHTFNLPTASATNRGALSSADWALFTQAYNDKINSAAVTGTTTKTLTLTQQDGGTITASWSDLNTDAVLSVFGRTGNVIAVSGDYTTAQVTESGNLYYTDARSRAALSFAAGSGAYNTSTGVITIPTNNNQITNGAGYITSAALAGYLPLTGGTLTGPLNGTSANFSSSVKASNYSFNAFSGGGEWQFGSDTTTGSGLYLYQTTYGYSFTLSSGGNGIFAGSVTANSFIKSGGTSSQFLKADGSVDSTSYVPSGRTITINGTTQDLSANRTFNVGTVTSVTASSPLASSGGTTPNITIQQASGSQSGFLSSTDWTTFNSKQNALTNPVTGTGTTNYLSKFTGSTTIGNSQVIDNGSQVGIGINPQARLQVFGGTGAYPTLGTNVTNSLFISRNDGLLGTYFGYAADGNGWIQQMRNDSATAYNLVLQPVGGNLLVGTTSDNGARLQVSGNVTTTGNIAINNSGFTAAYIGATSSQGFLNLYSGTSSGYNNGANITLVSSDRSGAFTRGEIYIEAGNASNNTANGFIQMLTGNAPRMTITSGGNVLIGTTSNGGNVNAFVSSYGNNGLFQSIGTDGALKLQMGGLGTNEAFFYTGPSNFMTFYSGGSEAMRIFSSRNVHIGPTPSSDNGARLQVSGTSTFSGNVTIRPTSGYNAFFQTSGTALRINYLNDALSANISATYRATDFGWQDSGGNSIFTLASTGAATFSSSVNVGGVSANTDFRIYRTVAPNVFFSISAPGGTPNTSTLGVNGTDVLALNASGNVGIGTQSPDTYSYGGTRKFLTFTATATNEEPFLQLIANGVGNSIIDFGNATIRRATIIGFDGSHLAFYTNGSNSGTSVSERMRITNIGNILFKGQSTTSLAEALFQNTNSALNFFATQTTSFSKDIGFFTDTTTAEERIRIVSTGNILMSFASAGNVIIGTTSDSGDRLRVTGGNGITFTDAIMTYNPNNDNRSGIAWRLGGVSIASITPNRRLRVNVGGVEYYIGAVEV